MMQSTDDTEPTDVQPIDIEAARKRINRLERRLERERDAREQAERFAEEGMRNLWRANQDLEQRVADRTAELERSLASATMAAAAKERFLADLGHELNTPLHAVLGLLELIDVSSLDDEDHRRIAEIRSNATELSDLLRSLIELAGATGAPAPADITTRTGSSWLDSAVEGWTGTSARRGQLLVPTIVGGETPLRLDWRRLDRIAHAAVANANQHGDPGTIKVAVSVDEQTIEVCVTDSGPGVTDDDAATAFEPFVKHGTGGGIGIGLSIAHRLAAGAGGDITMTGLGGSTQIKIVLPHHP